MKSATNELQTVIVQTLKADADVKAIVEGRVYDDVPADAEFPYLSLGPMISGTTLADCFEIDDISIQIDAWSRDTGSTEMRELADAARRALTKSDLELENNGLITFFHERTRELRDPDGLTSHAVIEFEASVQRFE